MESTRGALRQHHRASDAEPNRPPSPPTGWGRTPPPPPGHRPHSRHAGQPAGSPAGTPHRDPPHHSASSCGPAAIGRTARVLQSCPRGPFSPFVSEL
eukprot:4449532-Prymnesium_polylepis.1